jgi:hypothetical protein
MVAELSRLKMASIYFSNFADQRLYQADFGLGTPTAQHQPLEIDVMRMP